MRAELQQQQRRLVDVSAGFRTSIEAADQQWRETDDTNKALRGLFERFAPLAETSLQLAGLVDDTSKLAERLMEDCAKKRGAKKKNARTSAGVGRARRNADAAREAATEQLKRVDYFWQQARWLTERFPDAKLRDVEGLVKRVSRAEIENNDWSLTPGRYVGVAPEEEDANFDFAATMREIHTELDALNSEAATLAAKIKKNFENMDL